jgi:GAF domain-containing protein
LLHPLRGEDLPARYAAAVRAYLHEPDEAGLGVAYALGREALSAKLSVLELIEAHHAALAGVLRDGTNGGSGPDVVTAAGEVLRESLSAFEIAHRGYHAVQEVARVEREHAEQLNALSEASLAVNATLTVEEILQRAAAGARAVTGAARAVVAARIKDPEPRGLTATAPAGGTGDERPETGAHAVTRLADRRGRDLGLLEVFDSARPRFSRSDEAALDQLGQLVAATLVNAELYARQRSIAHVLQRNLLPGTLPAIPELPAAVRFSPAGEGIEVGGDFYDVFGVGDDAWVALIGDVCGKGPEAAAVTSLARHTMRVAALFERRPSEVLRLLHQALVEQRGDGRFCTVAYAELVPTATGATMALSCGGHPLPLLVRASGRVEPVGEVGTLIGSDIEPTLHDVSVELHHGDVLVMFTDGVIDVRGGKRELFGHSDLTALLTKCGGLGPQAIAARVQRAVLEASGGRNSDDVAVLTVGAAATAREPDPVMLRGATDPDSGER